MSRAALAVWAVLLASVAALSSVAHDRPEAWPLVLLSATLLATAVRRASPAQAAGLGWAWGSSGLCVSTWWLFISLYEYGGMPAGTAALAVWALAAALSLYWAAAMAATARWGQESPWRFVLLFVLTWLGAELARGQWFTGFPWAASGYSQVDGPLRHWAPWVGVYGLGAAVAAVGAGLAQAAAARRWTSALAWLLLPLGLLGGSGWARHDFTQAHGRLAVSLLQPNVAQQDKFDPQRLPELLERLRTLAHGAQGRLVVAPETAVPVLYDDLPAPFWRDWERPFVDPAQNRGLMWGVPLQRGEQYTNSVLAVSAQGLHRYDKHHLVPFGEFIPWGFRWFVNLMRMPLGDFARGDTAPPPWDFAGQRIAPHICYEDVFGEELARRFTEADEAPTVLVNVSNIAWFGRSAAAGQHLQMARMRALELQRPVVRATNTGATAAIDHRGRVMAELPGHVEGVLEVEVQGRDGLTPYAQWAGRWGLWPAWALVLLGVLGLALSAGPRRGPA